MNHDVIVVAEEAHATLGASNAERWLNCLGSVQAEEGKPNTDSVYATEGTAAHTLAEMAFAHRRDPDLWLNKEIQVKQEDGSSVSVIVSQEMVDAVRLYVTIILEMAKTATARWMERKFDLAVLEPPMPMFGTSDFGAFFETAEVLDVVDLKYGRGIVKVAIDNPQTRIYALGMWLEIRKTDPEMAKRIKWVRMTIVQPRVFNDDGEPHISEEVISIRDLKQWAVWMLERARLTMEPKAPRKAGDWCTFCKAKAECPTLRNVALATAQMEFSDLIEGKTPPPPEVFTPEELADVLDGLDMLDRWGNAVRAFALEAQSRGFEIPRYARKPRVKYRQWANVSEAKRTLAKLGLTEKEIMTPAKLRTPAQVSAVAKARKITIPDNLIFRPESDGFALCSADDARAIKSGQTDFEPFNEEDGD